MSKATTYSTIEEMTRALGEELIKMTHQGDKDLGGFRALMDWNFKAGKYVETAKEMMTQAGYELGIPMTTKGFRVFARCYAFKEGTTIEEVEQGKASNKIIPPDMYDKSFHGLAICEIHFLQDDAPKIQKVLQASFPTRFMELTTKVKGKA